jgi:hypothetical protein
MLQESPTIPASGLMTFDTLDEMRAYTRELLSFYERELDTFSRKVGSLMRIYEKTQKGQGDLRFEEDGWEKVGSLMVNRRPSIVGSLEILLEAMEEFRVKTEGTTQVLSAFEALEGLDTPNGALVTVYLSNGIPTKVVFDDPLPM